VSCSRSFPASVRLTARRVTQIMVAIYITNFRRGTLVPSVLVAYAVYAVFLACVRLFADPAVASALLRWPEILAQVLFTPLIAAWSIWIGLAISARSKDIRVAQQLGALACLPTVAVTSLVAFNVISPSFGLALAAAALLLVLDVAGWRLVSAMFNRERLITGLR
jgi:hypothetical protein